MVRCALGFHVLYGLVRDLRGHLLGHSWHLACLVLGLYGILLELLGTLGLFGMGNTQFLHLLLQMGYGRFRRFGPGRWRRSRVTLELREPSGWRQVLCHYGRRLKWGGRC